MSRAIQQFHDPVVGDTYVWPINHDEEQDFGQARNISTEANTGNVGLIRMQGDKAPLKLRFSGRMLERSHRDAFLAWFQRCQYRTILFTDVEGTVFEVLITSFNPIRKRAVRNTRDLVNAPTFTWSYTLEMDVIRVISGPLAGLIDP